MVVALKRNAEWKKQPHWLQGEQIRVSIFEKNGEKVPTLTTLYNPDRGATGVVKTVVLSHLFNEFETVTSGELEEAVCDGSCTSMTGDTVEPDGWDRQGFPSKLMAAGWC